MKKNLRIVSAAAAALLAIAPVAASTVSVNAASTANTTMNFGNNSSILPASSDVTVNSTVNAIAPVKVGNTTIPGSISGKLTATYGGQSYDANFTTATNNAAVYNASNNQEVSNGVQGMKVGTEYYASMSNVAFNFGSQNANKDVTIHISGKNAALKLATSGSQVNGGSYVQSGKTAEGATVNAHTDQNGVVLFSNVWTSNFTAIDATDAKAVAFYDRTSGTIVTSGDVSVNAGQNYRLNVEQVLAAFNNKYQAAQLNNGKIVENSSHNSNGVYNNDLTTTGVSEIVSQLKAQGITVDAQGYFEAPKSFTLNFTATSKINNAAATIPVTVNVPNGKEVKPATVDSVSKRVMHNAYYYDKDAKRVGTDSVKRYASVSVLPNTTTINGKTYYQVVENGQAVDKYINAANIDGTKRTLKHNAYVYASSKKRANKVVLKKGEVVTTYGASYTFKNGQKYYKIGDNTDKTYVKVANFR